MCKGKIWSFWWRFRHTPWTVTSPVSGLDDGPSELLLLSVLIREMQQLQETLEGSSSLRMNNRSFKDTTRCVRSSVLIHSLTEGFHRASSQMTDKQSITRRIRKRENISNRETPACSAHYQNTNSRCPAPALHQTLRSHTHTHDIF